MTSKLHKMLTISLICIVYLMTRYSFEKKKKYTTGAATTAAAASAAAYTEKLLLPETHMGNNQQCNFNHFTFTRWDLSAAYF